MSLMSLIPSQGAEESASSYQGLSQKISVRLGVVVVCGQPGELARCLARAGNTSGQIDAVRVKDLLFLFGARRCCSKKESGSTLLAGSVED